jgi:hypothetical protein
MKAGRLPLETALHYTVETARLLQELHQQDRSYGKLTPANLRLRGDGLQLRASSAQWAADGIDRDIRALGALLYEMLTGARVPVDANAAMFRMAGPRSCAAGIRLAGVRLAGKCLGLLDVKLSAQQAATEARVLWLLARQREESADLPKQLPPPFLVSRTQAAPEAAAKPAAIELREFEPAADPSPEPLGLSSVCTKCQGVEIRPSRSRSAFERMLERLGAKTYRCHRCYHRYVAIGGLQISKEMPVDTQRRGAKRRS